MQILEDLEYDASSPDEIALISAANHLGFEFVCRPMLNEIMIAITNENLLNVFLVQEQIDFLNEQRKKFPGTNSYVTITFHLFDMLEFDSVRKMMSVIILTNDRNYLILTKGADTNILKNASDQNESGAFDLLNDTLHNFACSGLRTLVFAYRIVSEDTAASYLEQLSYVKSCTSAHPSELAAISSHIESDFLILGCTGINDRLQDDVPQTIQAFKDAGINIWMLTGDKVETAISVAHSANLMDEKTFNVILSETDVTLLNHQ
uniref:Phospholipid-transporting ATPase 9 n=1 Tax=Dermatophagoides pteronyssinus TaxID=6956 RepID=A0A6P6Y4K2_DERPT|nr:putative phospholipid-transporting ATPase 9 [Dermatophagoides pteronyssinus]